jgi:hypothetical protein
MGEIKSTLELIMERTKNLSMSSEEKEENRRQEWLKKSRGWIQRFLDHQIELEKVREALLNPAPPSGWEELLKKELVKGLAPEGDNSRRLLLLETLLREPAAPYQKILNSFDHLSAQEKERQDDRLRKQWAGLGISGSALLPNLETDPTWQDFYSRLRQDCLRELEKI